MPPEALSASSYYGPSLDVFSFGHLALFTLIQVQGLIRVCVWGGGGGRGEGGGGGPTPSIAYSK